VSDKPFSCCRLALNVAHVIAFDSGSVFSGHSAQSDKESGSGEM